MDLFTALQLGGAAFLILILLSVLSQLRKLRLHVSAHERALRQRGELASEIAHEIKNPLTAILCSAETLDLLIGDSIDPTHRKSLSYIREYGDQLLKLVSDFLDVSSTESGNMGSQPESVVIAPVVESIVGLLEANAIRKKISIKILIPEEGACAFVDPKHLKQILFNLIHNAIKFTEPGGEIRVAVETEFSNPELRISVRDNGVGMSKRDLERVFQLYARYDGRGTARDVGTGLGLALCKSLAKLAGGSIAVESELGVGSAFTVLLPAREAVEYRSAVLEGMSGTPRTFEAKPLLGQFFLVLDSDTGSRESIANLLEAWGARVDCIEQAQHAVEAAKTQNYTAIMIDDSIDGGDPYELASLIRKNLSSEETKIIVATRDPLGSDKAGQSSADKCVEKPLSGDRLLTSILKSGKFDLTH